MGPDIKRSLTEQAIQQALLLGAQDLQLPHDETEPDREEPFKPNFRKIGLPALLGGVGLDVISTWDAGNRGLVEGNPLLGTDPKKAALISALVGGIGSWLLDKASKNGAGANKAANIAGIGLGALRGGIGIRNFRLGRE